MNAEYVCKILIVTRWAYYCSYCELFSYCYMCFISLWPRNWAFPWTWLSKFWSHNC